MDALSVNLANGQASVESTSNLSVYNPTGPSVAWSLRYDSLRGYDAASNFQEFGAGWSHSYSMGMFDPNPGTANVIVAPGGSSVYVTVTGTDAPANGQSWDIAQGGSVIASSSSPGGWSVYGGSYFQVSAPASVSEVTNLEVRCNLGPNGGGNKSAFIDVLVHTVPQGASAAIGVDGSESCASGLSWDITRNGVTVATSTAPNGWTADRSGSGNSALSISAPKVSATGSGYKARFSAYYYYAASSATFRVIGARVNPQAGTRYLYFPNGSRAAVTAPAVPSASQPQITCTVAAGFPYLVQWNYDANNMAGNFVVTQADRSRWVLAQSNVTQSFFSGGSPALNYAISQVVDNNNNALNFVYSGTGPQDFALLSSICDNGNQPLLTLNRATDGTGNVTSVQDRYGRSIYYHVGAYATVNAYNNIKQELDHVSQVVVTGASSPADHAVFGYQNINNGEGGEQVPILSSLTMPSATGTGAQTASIGYQAGTCFVTSTTDANHNVTTYTSPDANHTQVTTADSLGNVAYAYTAGFDMNMSQTTMTNGVVDAQGHNTQVISSQTYADSSNPLRSSQTLDGNGYGVNGAGGQGTTGSTWDQYGNCLSMTSARGTTTNYNISYANFAMGEMMSVQEGAKTPTTFSYFEPSGLIQTMKRAAPGSTGQANQTVTYSYTYDALGNVLTASEPGNNATTAKTTTSNYTQDGQYTPAEALRQPLTRTDSLGHTTHLRYDTRGNMTAVIDALGNETDFNYNSANQQTVLTFAATGETGTGRAQLLNTYLYPGGPKTSTSQYNEAGNSVYQETMTYGPEGESLIHTGSMQPVAQTYDAAYRVKTLTDGNNHATTYSYNANGYLNQITYPNGDTMQMPSYDTNGNLLQKIDGRGIVTNFVYNDVESRLTDVQYPATPAINVHVAYDGYGRRSGIMDGSGSQTASFDDLNSLTSVTTSYTGLAAQTVSYGYNADGSRSGLNAPYGGYTYTYDAAGRQTGLSNPGGHSWSWAYASNDWLTGQMADNTIVTTPSRDARGFLLDLSNNRIDMAHTTLSDYAISYSAGMTLGSINSSVPAVPAFSGTTSYQHDSKIQLTSEQPSRGGSYNNGFGYDAAGNPTTFKGAASTFNNANQNTASGYDGNGNPTSYKGNAITFDAENRLTAYGNVMAAGYRADGRRAWKQTGTGKTFYIYDGDKLLYETNAAGTVTAQNTWGLIGLVARQSGGRTLLYTWDAQGNVSQQIDAANGSIVASYMFDAFGTRGVSTTDATAPYDPYSGFGGSQGYYTDSETGLQLLGHRYYDPATGRFLTRDPISYAGGVNLYAYGSNSPFGGHDPSGMSFGGELVKCLGEAEHAFECIAALTKMIAIGTSVGIDCIPEAVCQTVAACVADGFFQCACEAAVIVTIPEAGELGSGCICGAVTSGLHYGLDLICNHYAGCEKKKFDPRCLFFNILMGTISGCIGGAISGLGVDIGGDTIITRLIQSLLNGMFDGASDMACSTNHWE